MDQFDSFQVNIEHYEGQSGDRIISSYVTSQYIALAAYDMSLVVRKPVFGVSDLVRHKPGCTATEDGWRLEISDLDSRGIVLSV